MGVYMLFTLRRSLYRKQTMTATTQMKKVPTVRLRQQQRSPWKRTKAKVYAGYEARTFNPELKLLRLSSKAVKFKPGHQKTKRFFHYESCR